MSTLFREKINEDIYIIHGGRGQCEKIIDIKICEVCKSQVDGLQIVKNVDFETNTNPVRLSINIDPSRLFWCVSKKCKRYHLLTLFTNRKRKTSKFKDSCE